MSTTETRLRSEEPKYAFPLTTKQKEDFVNNGVVVIDNVLTAEEVRAATEGLHETLKEYADVDVKDLEGTGQGLTTLSSTNGSGGVLDVFYPGWKMYLMTHPKLFSIFVQLWEVSYHHEPEVWNRAHQEYQRRLRQQSHEVENSQNDFNGMLSSHEQENVSSPDTCNTAAHITCDEKNCASGQEEPPDGEEGEDFRYHPYGPFDCSRGYAYIDRIGFRIPTKIAETLGGKQREGSCNTGCNSTEVRSDKKKKKQKKIPIQRSLTPHLDCCPDTVLKQDPTLGTKWRPIQCFLSLVDTLEPDHGGFEAVCDGFHRGFLNWASQRSPTHTKTSTLAGQDLCVGAYTHMRPTEDADVFARIRHVPCRAGSAVLWDYRIPHANARRNDGAEARAVVYASFLPDVSINRRFVKEVQLPKYECGLKPTDQWVNYGTKDANVTDKHREAEDEGTSQSFGSRAGLQELQDGPHTFRDLGGKLMGMTDW